MSVTADANVSTSVDLWGKDVDDLQSDIAISNANAITGTLKYIDDYSSAFGPGEDSGNYICLHFAANVPGASISVKITNPVTLDEDGIFVGRIADKSTQTITVVASKAGYASDTKVFDLSGLTCLDS